MTIPRRAMHEASDTEHHPHCLVMLDVNADLGIECDCHHWDQVDEAEGEAMAVNKKPMFSNPPNENLTERPEDTVRRYATRFVRLQEGLQRRGVDLTTCTEDQVVLWALKTIDQLQKKAYLLNDQLARYEKNPWHMPRHGDAVEKWLRSHRDSWGKGTTRWDTVDRALSHYRRLASNHDEMHGAVSGTHRYTSTACLHEMHQDCRMLCKFCDTACVCECHHETKLTHIKLKEMEETVEVSEETTQMVMEFDKMAMPVVSEHRTADGHTTNVSDWVAGESAAPPAHPVGEQDQDRSSRAERARKDVRRGTTWRGDSAIHTQVVIDQMDAMGESTTDADGDYVGLTFVHLMELMKELEQRRDNDMRLRNWLSANTKITGLQANGHNATDEAIKLMDVAGASVRAVWPVLQGMWTTAVTMYGNVEHTWQEAGILEKKK